MFETSVVHARNAANARSRVTLLSISIVAHTAIILGSAAVSVASVDFPKVAPDEVANAPMPIPVVPIPPPLGNPNGGAPPKPAAAPPVQKPATPPPPNQLTAPAEIPNDLPPADTPVTTGSDSTATGPASGPGTEPGPLGQPWGVDGGIGDLNAPPATNTAPPVEEKVYVVSGEVKAPVALYKPQPPYPPALVRTRMRATVTVRCIIDKSGHVRDPQIIAGSLPPFNDAVINTVMHWRFQPGSYRGHAVETFLDLTVNFAIK